MAKAESSKKGGKKIGRSFRSPAHNRYNSTGRYYKNKIAKVLRHIRQVSVKEGRTLVCNDKSALAALKARRG